MGLRRRASAALAPVATATRPLGADARLAQDSRNDVKLPLDRGVYRSRRGVQSIKSPALSQAFEKLPTRRRATFLLDFRKYRDYYVASGV